MSDDEPNEPGQRLPQSPDVQREALIREGRYLPNEILEKLESLPKGTTIGVRCPQNIINKLGGSRYSDVYDLPTYLTFKELIPFHNLKKECLYHGLKLQGLEDEFLHTKIARLRRAHSYHYDVLVNGDSSNSRSIELRRRLYSIQTHTQWCQRVETIGMYLNEISELGIEVSFGFEEDNLTENMSICFSVSNAKRLKNVFVEDNIETFVSDSKFKTDNKELNTTWLIYQSLTRKMNGLKLNRLVPQFVPSYIGTFTHAFAYTPEQGMFEVFPDENGKSGIIVDTDGIARYSNFKLSNGTVEFTKIYEPNTTLETPPDTIHYEGKLDDSTGMYKGRWTAQSGPYSYFGEFNMVPFWEDDPNMVKNLLHRTHLDLISRIG